MNTDKRGWQELPLLPNIQPEGMRQEMQARRLRSQGRPFSKRMNTDGRG